MNAIILGYMLLPLSRALIVSIDQHVLQTKELVQASLIPTSIECCGINE